MRQMAHRAGASAARGGPSKTPIMALTDLLGTMRLVGVTVSPMRRVASRDARSRPCASSGQSPYPHEKRQLHERPAAGCRVLHHGVEMSDGGLDERGGRCIVDCGIQRALCAERAQAPLVVHAERACEHRAPACVLEVAVDVTPPEGCDRSREANTRLPLVVKGGGVYGKRREDASRPSHGLRRRVRPARSCTPGRLRCSVPYAPDIAAFHCGQSRGDPPCLQA